MAFIPRSLRQLVLLAFLLVLLPLLVLAYQAYQSLDHLSAQAADINRTTLVDARRSEAMTSVALEMERSYRQYCVLVDPTLQKLYQNQRKQYSQMLDAHAPILPDERYYQTLRQLLTQLAAIKCHNSGPDQEASALLESFSRSNAEMVQATRAVVFSRGQQLQQAIAERGQFFGWQALLLFPGQRAAGGAVHPHDHRAGQGRGADDQPHGRRARAGQHRVVQGAARAAFAGAAHHLAERAAGVAGVAAPRVLRHISHELKTPLASMREGTELLADEVAGPLTSDQKEVVAILDNSSRHLQQLIEQLLDYNRKLADGPAEHENVELRDMVDLVVAAHSLPARAKMISTEITLEAEICWAEPTLLMRVLDNLYSNAVHYGKESGNIWIRSRQVDNGANRRRQ